MAVGFRVRYRSTSGDIDGQLVLFQLPIRFGRNALNHCQIAHGYISDFHATVEIVDGRLCVRDLNSKNGVYLPSGQRIAANVPVSLAASNNAFVLGQLAHVQIEPFEEARPIGARPSDLRGSVLGNRAFLDLAAPANSRLDVSPLPPLSAEGQWSVARPPMVSREPSPPWGGPAQHNQSLPPLAHVAPSADHGARGAQPLPAAGGRDLGRGTAHFTMSLEAMALLGLRELGASLVPGAPLQTTGDVARLLTKLHDTVEVFVRCFVPMREAYTRFVSSMDLRTEASQRAVNRSPSAAGVEVARDAAGVAAALLDWRNDHYDAPEVVEGIFADLVTHQLALVDGITRGVQALLEEISPERVEAIFEAERPGGMPALLGRYRGLWQTYKTHYGALKSERRALELVLGEGITDSYREYSSRRDRQTR